MPRRYDYPQTRDPLEALSICRRQLIANKERDFAADIEASNPWVTWPPVTHSDARSVATGEPITTLSREDFNAQRRESERKYTIQPRYRLARMRAMRPVSGLAMAEMRAMATRCVTQVETLQATYRRARAA